MAKLKQYLRNLWQQGLELWLEDGQLRFSASEQLTSDALTILREHKADIIAILKQRPDFYTGYPLSEGQRSIKLMQDLAPESVAYNQLGVVCFRRRINPSLLRQALNDLAQRHEQLRTTIDTIEGIHRQMVHPHLSPSVSAEVQANLNDQQIIQWGQHKADQPFDLGRGPLLRAHLLVNELNDEKQYILAFIAHHIIADYWTMERLLKELSQIYDALDTNQSAELTPLKISYKDYVLYESKLQTTAKGEKQRNYWTQALAENQSPVLELPCDHPRPVQQSYHGAEIQFPFDVSLSQQIRATAKQNSVTPFVLVLTAYQILLHRYSGENFIVVGTPMACRHRPGAQDVAGHFTNPVPMCIALDNNPVLKDLLQQNQKRTREALMNQEYPFQKLLDQLNVARDHSRTPIFQVALSWNQQDMGRDFLGPDAIIEDILLMEQRGSLYDLVLTCYDGSDSINSALRYNSDIFNATTIKRFARHLAELLRQITQQPQASIGDYSYITSREMQQIHQWNDTQRSFPDNDNLAQLFDLQVEQRPDQLAVNDTRNTLTYQECQQAANQLAHFLTAQGLKPGQILGIAIPSSNDYIVAVLACLKLGAIYMPLDTNYPDERLQIMLEETKAPLVLCYEAAFYQRLCGLALPHSPLLIDMKAASGIVSQHQTGFSNYHHDNIGTQTACILFTSGSTGRPKGVLIPHKAISRLVCNSPSCDIQADDVVGQSCSLAFDAFNWEAWGALLNGASLVMTPKESLLNAEALGKLWQATGVNVVLLPTALVNLLCAENPALFKPLRILTMGGEALDPVTIAQIQQHSQPEQLFNLYGPTENGTVSTAYDTMTGQAQCHSVSIGKPIANSTVYIQDSYGKLTPIGVPGEIFVGGSGLANGYLNQPEQTAKAFGPNPYHSEPNERLYATGDLGRWLPSGDIEILGRIDNQVKIRGFRLELGEIETALKQLPEVSNCCIVLINDEEVGKYLAAYIVTSNPTDQTDSAHVSAKIRQKLKERLPEYMIPASFNLLNELPVTANGKVDKRALPKPVYQQSAEYLAPRNAIEQTICEVWQNLFHGSRIGIYDHFFDLGGHSLLATQAASRLQEALDCPVNMRDIFHAPTAAELAQRLSEQQETSVQHYPLLQPYTGDKPAQLSLAQQRIWFVQQLNQSGSAYNMPTAILLNKTFSMPRMQAALAELSQRHQALRTRFVAEDGQAYQIIDEAEAEFPVEFIDLQHCHYKDEAVTDCLTEFANIRFDLEQQHPIRVSFIQLADQHWLLALNVHHIIADGWSAELLLHDLGSLYQQHEKLMPLSLQYQDYSEWQRQWLQGQILEQQLAYWREKLKGTETVLHLSTDYPRPPQQSFRGSTLKLHLSQNLVNRLQDLGQRHNASLFMVLMAAYSLLLSRHARQDDLCIGFPMSGRSSPELENMMGIFVNNLALRCQPDRDLSISEYLAQIRSNTLEAYSHQDVPFDTLVDALQIERSLAYTPLVQASLVLQKGSLNEMVQDHFGTTASALELDLISAKYDLNLICYETQQSGINAVMEYASDLFKPATIERMLGHFEHLLESFCTGDQQTLKQLNLIRPHERKQLLALNPGPQQAYPQFLIHQRFEQIAALYPQKTALIEGNQSLDYSSLNRQANQIARALQAKGIKPGDYVGLHLDRSQALIASILAILKAGAAYIPLDPHHPPERLKYILDDSKASLLLSTQALSAALATDTPTLNLDTDAKLISAQEQSNLNLGINPRSTIYIIYTSGTTGKPKGCLLTHNNVSRLFSATETEFGFNEQDTWTLFHSFAFDFSVWEIWGALLYGGKLLIVPYWLSRSPEDFYQALCKHQVTVLNQTPSAFSQLIALDKGHENTELGLRYVIFGGEALDFNALSTWAGKHGLKKPALINMYGITETTVHVTHHTISHNDLAQGRSIIGRPIHDLHAFIVNRNNELTPIGVPGEILVSGPGVSSGYLRRDELTTERFIDNYFKDELPEHEQSQHPSLYRSGDLARYLDNGEIEYLGRIDQQVKIRGHRIELGEIEAQLTALENVREAVVLVSDDNGDKRLIAYLLPPKGEDDIELSGLREQLSQMLPDYMLPTSFMVLSEWPLTGNGKVDKKALPKPEGHSSIQREYIAPRNETETQIIAIWEQILEHEKIGIHDNFFELGGHSLLATQVMARIKEQLDVTLELKCIFEYPTVEGLAMLILEAELSGLDSDDLENLLADEDLDGLLDELDD